MPEQTIGQKRVRVSFNPSGTNIIDQIKQKSADLIDMVEDLKEHDPRLASLAQTNYEVAAMFAVKLASSEGVPLIKTEVASQVIEEPRIV